MIHVVIVVMVGYGGGGRVVGTEAAALRVRLMVRSWRRNGELTFGVP